MLREYIRSKFGKCETDINSKLSNVFIKPVQRIFKYPLLVSKLIEVRYLLNNLKSLLEFL